MSPSFGAIVSFASVLYAHGTSVALKRYEARLAADLERMKGEVRREVEADLKSHEASLRVASEIDLRLRERALDGLAAAAESFDGAVSAAMNLVAIIARPSGDDQRMSAQIAALNAIQKARLALRSCPVAWSDPADSILAELRDAPRAAELGMDNDAIFERVKSCSARLHDVTTGWKREVWTGYRGFVATGARATLDP